MQRTLNNFRIIFCQLPLSKLNGKNICYKNNVDSYLNKLRNRYWILAVLNKFCGLWLKNDFLANKSPRVKCSNVPVRWNQLYDAKVSDIKYLDISCNLQKKKIIES